MFKHCIKEEGGLSFFLVSNLLPLKSIALQTILCHIYKLLFYYYRLIAYLLFAQRKENNYYVKHLVLHPTRQTHIRFLQSRTEPIHSYSLLPVIQVINHKTLIEFWHCDLRKTATNTQVSYVTWLFKEGKSVCIS